jgi:hypothetical protein
MVVLDPTPPGDPVLDHALATIAASRPVEPENLIATLCKRLRSTLLERLSTAGALRRSTRTAMGVFPLTIWSAADAGHKQELRARLPDVLVAGAAPDPRTAVLVSLLAAVDAAHTVVDGDRKVVRARAKEIAAGDRAGDAVKAAVKKVIDAANASLVIIFAAGAVSGGGSRRARARDDQPRSRRRDHHLRAPAPRDPGEDPVDVRLHRHHGDEQLRPSRCSRGSEGRGRPARHPRVSWS